MLDARGKRIVWTYSILNNYEQVCPHQTQHRYVLKSTKFVETVQMKWGNDVHTAMEQRVGYGKPLPDSMKDWEQFAAPFDGRHAIVEQKLGLTETGHPCDFWSDEVYFRGKIDLQVLNDEQCLLVDHKTGKSAFENPFELETSAMLVHAHNPKLKKFAGHYLWLAENRLGKAYDLSNTSLTWATVNDIVAAIEKSHASGEWKKKPGGLCGWCDVSSCEHWRARK